MLTLSQVPISKPSDCWQTPDWLWQRVALALLTQPNQTLYDPCPPNPTVDGLNENWQEHVYCNPPYSNPHPWVLKAREEAGSDRSTSIIFCLNHDHSTDWWADLTPLITTACLVGKRVRFTHPQGEASEPGKRPTILTYYGPYPHRFNAVFHDIGTIIHLVN